jgi:hypothetical protein
MVYPPSNTTFGQFFLSASMGRSPRSGQPDRASMDRTATRRENTLVSAVNGAHAGDSLVRTAWSGRPGRDG